MIFPTILCGGSGTRLWPLSRKSFPKQFAKINGDITLFQQSAARLTDAGFGNPVIVTGDAFRFVVADWLADIGIEPQKIVVEPEARNTAPAILAAALSLQHDVGDVMMIVMPSDHVIPDAKGFEAAVMAASATAEEGKIVTFGIAPTAPETGYGYLELEKPVVGEVNAPLPLEAFVEKPSKEVAEKMLAAGNYLWNAGIFLFKTSVMIKAFKEFLPKTYDAVKTAMENSHKDITFIRPDIEAWAEAENVSIDYGIMEKFKPISAMPFDKGWSDLGGWNTVWEEAKPDEYGVVAHNNATAIDCKDTLLRSEDETLKLSALVLKI